jgi:hypothetical protein
MQRFTHHDDADLILGPGAADGLAVVTGFGPTNAPTAGTLSVMLGVIALQRALLAPVTVVISELGAWNSRNVPWPRLEAVRDQMVAFLQEIGFDTGTGVLRSHLDHANLVRAGKIARFLARQDFLDHQEELLGLYESHGLLGSEIGLMTDSLYTVADVLGPADDGADRILMLSGAEEAYFTGLARLVLARQAGAGPLALGWDARVGALYFRVLPGLGGYPKMSKSIPASSIHLAMPADDLAARILDPFPASQEALLAAIELSSGWDDERLTRARTAYSGRDREPASWDRVRREYLDSFLGFAALWRECAA